MTAGNRTTSKKDSWVAPRNGGYAARVNGNGPYVAKKAVPPPDPGQERTPGGLPPGRGSAAKSE